MTQNLLFVILLICCPVFSLNTLGQSHWIPAALDASGKPYYVDANLLQQPNGNILGWEKSNLPLNGAYPIGAYFVARYEWNCANKMSRQLQVFIYEPSGDFIEKMETDTSWKYTPPESIGETILKSVCGAYEKKRNNPIKNSPDRLFAQITVKQSYLMSDADPNSRRIRKVVLGENFVLTDERPVGSWFQVIDLKTKSKCWLNDNYFKIVRTSRINQKAKNFRKKS